MNSIINKDNQGDLLLMGKILILLAIIGVWFILQAYILPRMGVST